MGTTLHMRDMVTTLMTRMDTMTTPRMVRRFYAASMAI